MEKITVLKWIRFLLYIFGTRMKVAAVCRDAAFIRKQGKSLNEDKGTVLLSLKMLHLLVVG